jgi:integrase
MVDAIIAADISDATKSQYIRNLETIKALSGNRSFEEIVRHPNAMYQRIATRYPCAQTQKSFVSSVKALFKYNPALMHSNKENAERWHALFKLIDKSIMDRTASAQPTQRELLNWVQWPEVQARQQQLSGVAYGTVDHLLLSMYSLIEPLRADYGNVMLLTPSSPELQQQQQKPLTFNYIILSDVGGESKLVLNTYKTVGKYGPFVRALPEEVVHIIRYSLRLLPRQYLFVDERGEPYTKKNSYTRFANRTLERLFGKKFTISLLRHSFISNINFNESTPKQLFDHARNMAHSIGMQQLYRRKVPSLNVTREYPPAAAAAAAPPPPPRPPPHSPLPTTSQARPLPMYESQSYVIV